ncbi:ead/Ea22-like family protein [Enterobacter asburiae]|uniref:ead/Ea22-like family protein n=1 Tax=Enterobacter asburiae TaxID=61645 RepID=UPI0034D171AC
MSNIDKHALRGLSVESPFYLAECCNCGEIMPSSKLRESRNYPDDDGECHCPHCNADDCDIADSGAVGSEGVTAWNYQQKRIEALLDELEAAEKRIAELSHHLQCAHAFIEHTEAFGYEASNGILCCGDAQWNIDASKSALAAADKGEAS